MRTTLRALCASLLFALPAAYAAPTVPALRLYVFDCGSIDVSDISLFSPGVNVGKSKKLTDSCYLVVHPKGTLMWDTGFNDELAKTPDGQKVGGAFHITLKQTLTSQLKAVGYAPSDIAYLGISHTHFDHIGNVALFPKATLLMQKEELDSALGPDAAKYGHDPKDYPTLAANPAKPLGGDHDVFGDGSVVIKRAIGHTPGHQMLYLKLPKTGNVLLSGDLAHFTENWEQRRVPGFNFNKEQSTKAMDDAAAFLKAEQATLWIQHDLEQNAAIKHAPAYYE
ncbi:MAG: N-acyl homoserine lactonase family protein [Pseudomonadota bacterium]